jgi:uncharacterized protein
MAAQSRAMAQVIPANEYRRERWRNGAGWTREIAAGRLPGEPAWGAGGPADGIQVLDPDAGDDWMWRLSVAEIERDGAYSPFPGVEREQVLLSGNGLRLVPEGGEPLELLPPHGRGRFHGGIRIEAKLVDGPSHVFNLMWRPAHAKATLWHRPLVGPMVLFVEPGNLWAIHLLAGQARFDADAGLPPMAAGDTALLAAGASRRRYAFDGGGEVLLVRLEPVGAATEGAAGPS